MVLGRDCGHDRPSGPEIRVPGGLHFRAAPGTTLSVPLLDALTSAAQAQPAHHAVERWCRVADDATHHQGHDIAAVGTVHHDDVLAHEAPSLVHVGLITACHTFVFNDFRHEPNSMRHIAWQPVCSHDDGGYTPRFGV